jgi:hypothetical protein
MVRKFIMGALLVIGLGVTPANAQGGFDFSAISREMVGAKANTTPPAPAEVKAFSFKPSATLRKQNLDKFINTLIAMDPGFAGQLQGVDLVDMIEGEISKYGLSTANVADAYTVYLLAAHAVVNGVDMTEAQPQIDGTRNMVFQTMQTIGGVEELSDADKQSMAEGLILQAALFDAVGSAVREDAALTKKVQNDVRTAALELGLDLSQFVMGPNGLARK